MKMNEGKKPSEHLGMKKSAGMPRPGGGPSKSSRPMPSDHIAKGKGGGKGTKAGY